MAAPPRWVYSDLTAPARWLLASGLPTALTPPAEPLEPAQWESLVAQAGNHGLEGLLVAAVADGSLPVTTVQRARSAVMELDLTRRRMAYEKRAGAALALLDAAGIEVRLLKGLAVARLEYPDDQLRPTGDLDVLVRPSQIDAAVAALVAAGGQWADPEPTVGFNRYVAKGATVYLPSVGIEVDLHRLLVWGPFGVRLPPEELWIARRSLTVGGVQRFTLGREETLLHACAHQLVLGVTRAREARDVAQMLCNPALDVERLLGLARRWGQEALVATAALLAERELALTADAHPLHAWAHGYPVTLRDRLWLRTEAPVGRLHGIEQAAVWWELGPGPARRILVRANLRPAPGTYRSPQARMRALASRLTSPMLHTLMRKP